MKKNAILFVFIFILSFNLYSADNSGQLLNELEIKMIQIPGAYFEMMSTEVTQKMYEAIIGTNPSRFKGENLPVEMVNWDNAVRFCNELSIKMGFIPVYIINGNNVTLNASGNGYRLPTEREWVYAAKGGENYIYAGSDNIDEVAWSGRNSGEKPHPVAQKKPNGFGLYDMSGNVKEWCWDSHTQFGDVAGHYVRGGGWISVWESPEDACKVSHRSWNSTDNTDTMLGFRVVREVE